MTLNTDQTVREIAIGNPATVRVFESLGIDYCCGGKRPLQEACDRANVPVARALELLDAVHADPTPPEEQGWTGASFEALIEHIVARHHSYIRQEAPRLNLLLDKVADKHGAAHPEVVSIQELFAALSQELFAHLLKEEQVLFPFILRMEAAAAETGGKSSNLL